MDLDDKLATLRIAEKRLGGGKSGVNSDLRGPIQVQPLDSFIVRQTHSFDIHAPGYAKEELEVLISGVSKTAIQSRIVDLQNSTFRVYFSVTVVGTHVFQVYAMGIHRQLLHTFTGKAYDVSKILITGVGSACFLNEIFEFIVDASQAGEGQLEIAVNEGETPNQVNVMGNGRCSVSFKPVQPIEHVVDIKFNGRNVPGCPFQVSVTDTRQFSVHLAGAELLPVGSPATFSVRSKNPLQPSQLQVSVTAPSGKSIPVELSAEQLLSEPMGSSSIDATTSNNDQQQPNNCSSVQSVYEVFCTLRPIEIGPHLIHVRHLGRLLTSNPHVMKTFDASKVNVQPAQSGCLAKPVEFIVDASAAGEGNLEIAVHSHNRNVLTQVYSLGGAKFRVEFVPERADPHVVSVAFNTQRVPNSPFTVTISGDGQTVSASGGALHFAPVRKISQIRLHNAVDHRLVKARVEAPNGQPVKLLRVLPANEPNCALVQFEPDSTGEHCIHLNYDQRPVPGSPFTTKVYDLSAIQVKEMPDEIRIGEPITFLVEASNAGPGNLEVIVNNGKVPSTPEALGAALYAITFVPQQRCTHLVHIKFNGELVNGAPFKLNILDASLVQLLHPPPERHCVRTPLSLQLSVSGGLRLTEECVQVLSPSQRRLPVELVELGKDDEQQLVTENASVEIQYEIRCHVDEVGDHLIDVRVAGESIAGCPLVIKVFDSQKVKLTDLHSGQLQRPVYFTIDASQAGAGNLEIIVSVNGRNVPNYVQSEGNARFKVNFTPTDPAAHQVSVKFNGQPVTGSPFQVPVQPMDTTTPTTINTNESISPIESLNESNSLAGQLLTTNELSLLRVVSLRRGICLPLQKQSLENQLKLTFPPELIVQTPGNKRIAAKIIEQSNQFLCEYIPTEVGPHQLLLYLNKQLVSECCPFTCNVYDVAKVRLSGLEKACVGIPLTFQVDASHAGEGTLELVVSTRKCSVRAEVLMRSRGLYDVTFVPQQPTSHYVNVTFNEEDVPGSPFKVDVQLPDVGLGAITGLQTIPEAVGLDEQSDSNEIVASTIPCKAGGNLEMDWNVWAKILHQLIGRLSVRASSNNFVIGSVCQLQLSFDEQQLQSLISSVQSVKLANLIQPYMSFQSCLIENQSQRTTTTARLLSTNETNKLQLEFMPKEAGECWLQLRPTARLTEFLDKESDLLDQPLLIGCADPSRVRLLHVQDGLVGQLQQFSVDCSKAGTGELQLQITCKQQPISCELFELDRKTNAWQAIVLNSNNSSIKLRSRSGIYKLRYLPTIDLPHYIDVLYTGHQAAGCPQLVEIRDPLELLSLDAKSVAKLKFVQLNAAQDLLIVANGFKPDVQSFSCDLYDCQNKPIKCNIEEHSSNTATTTVATSASSAPSSSSSSSSAEKRMYRVSFKPTRVGTCRLEVNYRGQSLNSSPLLCECFDINQVQLRHPIWESDQQQVNQSVCLEMDRKNAGYAELDVVVTSPLGRHLPIELKAHAQKELICFVPTVPGMYKVAIAYGGLPVPGTPVMFEIKEPIKSVKQDVCRNSGSMVDGSKLSNQNIRTANGNGSSLQGVAANKMPIVTLKGESCALHKPFLFTVDANEQKGLPQINIDGPNGEADVVVEESNPRLFVASFVPTMIGIYEIRLCWAGHELTKTPFKVAAVDLNQVRPKHGWESVLNSNRLLTLQLNQVKKITFLTNDAGPGKLRGELMLPNGQCQSNVIESCGSHKYRFVYTPKQPGTYTLNLFYADLLLPQCPLVASAADPKGRHSSSSNGVTNGLDITNKGHTGGYESRVTFRGQGVAGAFAGQTAQFIIDGSAADPGEPHCTLRLLQSDPNAPTTASISGNESLAVVNLEPIAPKVYRVNYTAKVAGIFSLNVIWAGRQVAGCPLELKIAAKADAGRVKLQLPKSISAGRKCQFEVQLAEAGPGQLSAHLVGPNGQVITCQLSAVVNQRQTLTFVPEVVGKHTLTVRFAGQHVPGSPFDLQITTAPDASKVNVHGPGVEHGVLPLYQSRFVCDTSGAGAGEVTVRVSGPKGAFRVEMCRDPIKDRSIICKYDPTEPGHYRIEVKWSGDHVPNSPFDVYIFDTQAELNRFLHSGTIADRTNSVTSVAHLPADHHLSNGASMPAHGPPHLNGPHPIPIGQLTHGPAPTMFHLPSSVVGLPPPPPPQSNSSLAASTLPMNSPFLINDYFNYAPLPWHPHHQHQHHHHHHHHQQAPSTQEL